MKQFIVIIICILLICSHTFSSILKYGEDERFDFTLSFQKPIIWSLRSSDTKDDEKTPFENEGVYKFDLKEILEETELPTALSLSINMYDIVEPRITLELLSLHYYKYNLSYTGSTVDRKDLTLDILLGYNLN